MSDLKAKLTIPEGYKALLNIRETGVAIKKVKDFLKKLAEALNLIRLIMV